MSPRARAIRAGGLLAVGLLAASAAACGDTDPATDETPGPTSSSAPSTSSTMETYHGDPGMSDAGTAGGDANPDDEVDSRR